MEETYLINYPGVRKKILAGGTGPLPHFPPGTKVVCHTWQHSTAPTPSRKKKKRLHLNPFVILNVTAPPRSVRMYFKLFTQPDNLLCPWFVCGKHFLILACALFKPGHWLVYFFFLLFPSPDSHPATRLQRMSVHFCVCRSVFSPGSRRWFAGIVVVPSSCLLTYK